MRRMGCWGRGARSRGGGGKRRTIPTLGVALWIASGCAGGGGPPGWVQGEAPADHPEVAYLSAVGAGESLDAARAAAKAELSRIFSAELDSVVRLVDEERTRSGVAVAESVLRVDTTIRSGLELQGAEVPLHWRDPETGEVWAVAVLDRRRECARLREAGDDLATRLDRRVDEASREAHPLAAVRASLRAVALGLELDGLRARSRVLGRDCLAPRSHATGALLADLGARMEALRFVVDARDVDASSGAPAPLPQLRERIASDLTELGFRVATSGGPDVIPIEARVRLRRVERGTDWVEFRWEGSAEVGSPVPGAPAVLVVEGEGAESHPEAGTARLRARRKAELVMAQRLRRDLEAFLEPDADRAPPGAGGPR